MTETDSTRISPQTDNTDAILDQVLMFSPTEIPKYSLISQKPESLTCENNNEQQPLANTSKAT